MRGEEKGGGGERGKWKDRWDRSEVKVGRVV